MGKRKGAYRVMSTNKLYSDGACSGNPGPGGYGAIFFFSSGGKIFFKKGFELTTNNRMELLGIIDPLENITEHIKDSLHITIFTDSQYIANSINKGWLKSWENNRWRGSNKKKVKNIDLWKRFISLSAKHEITVKWVKGHSSNIQNQRCDEMAVTARQTNLLHIDVEYERMLEQKKENLLFEEN